MTKLGIIQTGSFRTNKEGIIKISALLEELGRKKTDIVCLPEQWLKENRIDNFSTEFAPFLEIAKKYSMTIIPGAFYQKIRNQQTISSPVIGPKGTIIGIQEKIHPFDYERDIIKPGKLAKIFETSCKFGVVICYDMVFPDVVNMMVRKGAKVILSPSRIVKRGIQPWHMYCQVRALENRVPILAANVHNYRFGGESIMIDLVENNKVVIPKITKLKKQCATAKQFDLEKYYNIRKRRFSDVQKFS
ncbi:MAG: carbon-nitrogen hydrolase family protein [Nitrosopumilaceae archaeon]|nr:carbon-nitrogen hydrolase family protein [Nitrosopumilaceae archaeon]